MRPPFGWIALLAVAHPAGILAQNLMTTPDAVNGREDLSLAMAAMLVSYRGIRPVTTVILRLDTPTGSLPGREHSWRPSGRAVFGWELPGRFALHCNVGVTQESVAGKHFARGFGSLWLSRRVAGRLGFYGEMYGSTAHGGGSAWEYGSRSSSYLPVWAWRRSNPAPTVESRAR